MSLVARPKFQYVRSPRLLQACRKLACQHCGRRDGTVCAAHSNWAVHGKGKGIKASDIYVAALCFLCHAQLDQGGAWSELQRRLFWWLAHCLTVLNLRALDLWPARVPAPDISDRAKALFLEDAP